jgi:mRNA interferase MazF
MAAYCPEVSIPAGLKASGVVLSDQIKSMDWNARGASFLCSLPETVVRQVLNKVGTLLDA